MERLVDRVDVGGGKRSVMEGKSVAEVQLFREDVVQYLSDPSVIGVVSKVGGDSDSEDSSNSEDEEEEEVESEEDEDLTKGSARVYWMTSDETTEKLEDIQVVDRAFLHGDIVAKVDDPLGQTGTVVNVEMKVDLEQPDGEVMKDVNSRRLRHVRAFELGDYVIHNSWIGRVDEVTDVVTVAFDDGAKCKVHRADIDRLIPCSEYMIDHAASPYYPGQRVRCASSSVFKHAKWLKGSWKVHRTEGTVVDVEAGSVLVSWIAAGNALSSSQASAVPSEEQDGKNLLPVVYFSHTKWQLGNRSLPPNRMRAKSVIPLEATVEGVHSDYDVESSAALLESAADSVAGPSECCKDVACGQASHRRKSKQRQRTLKRDKKLQKREKKIEHALLIVSTRTSVDVLWQDGTVSRGLEALSLIPVDHLGDHDFWPQQYVLERGTDGEGFDTEPRRVGVVKTVDAKERTAVVRWLKGQRPEEPREFESQEIVSVYELAEHPDYTYCLGDIVIRLVLPSTKADQIPSIDELDAAVSSGGDASEFDGEENDGDASKALAVKPKKRSVKKKSHPRENVNQDLSWVGVIIRLQDGDIEVAWADGTVSKEGPQAILVVNRDLEDASSSANTSDLEDAEGDIDDSTSWETVLSDEDLSKVEQEEEEPWGGREGTSSEDPVAETVDEGHNEDVVQVSSDTGGRGTVNSDHGRERSRPQRLGGPFRLPLVAIGFVSRLAAGLWAHRGPKKGADSTTGTKASTSQSRVKQSLEEILDEERSSRNQEQGSESPKRLMVERVTPCKRDALRMLNDTILNPPDKEGQELEMTSSMEVMDVVFEDRDSTHSSADSSSNLQEEQAPTLTDTYQTPDESASGDEFVDTEKRSETIKHFDLVKDAADHHYVGQTDPPTNNRKWVKKIQQEWSMLEKGLPDTIYVRVYEERMDLIRAVIVGAAGTPYHDGLFVFDIYLPPEYPGVPPVVHYQSGGLRLNPNLYENGKVCLSLLNTWTGKGSEVWHPITSSILQVLVSIQGLVLNEKPYFNEAGYDRQIGSGEGEKNSIAYNENSFLLSCKSMLYHLRRPYMHFEELTRQHFQQRGKRVIQACRAYLAGAEVGGLKESDLQCVSEVHFEDKSSAGFKLMLKKLVPKLTAAFLEVGASIDEPFDP
ncbi:hypothetical protein R1flu_023688 [Riccia fluitans]|uniref:E2 ubiquitin-conjugating enzyme n=1 Tax=Riccia fluitans TaxID=41844 RepID=A0ABD1XVQ9_9MARC